MSAGNIVRRRFPPGGEVGQYIQLNANKKPAWAAGSTIAGHKASHESGGADEIPNIPTAAGKTAADAIGAASGATTALKLANLTENASTTQEGVAEFATAAELVTGTDDTRAVNVKQLKDATALADFWLTKRTKMPDGATAVYVNDEWSGTPGWVGGTIAYSGGAMVITAAGSSVQVYSPATSGVAGKIYMARVKSSKAGATVSLQYYNGGYPNLTTLTLPVADTFVVLIARVPLDAGSTRLYLGATGLAISDTISVDWVWVGDYSYLTGSLSEEAARIANELGDTPGVGNAATATITNNGTQVTSGDTVTIGGKVYTFTNTLTGAEGEVYIQPGDPQSSIQNLMLAIRRYLPSSYNFGGTSPKYSCAAAHPLVTTASISAGFICILLALTPGINGNQITIAKSAATLTLANPAGGSTTLAGGRDASGDKAKTQVAAAIGAGAAVGAMPNRTSTSIIGYRGVADCASGAQVTLPAGGTWLFRVATYGATYNSVMAGTAAGGLMSGTASANLRMFYERIA